MSIKQRLIKLEACLSVGRKEPAALIVLERDQSESEALFEYMALNGLTDEPKGRIIFIVGISPSQITT